ncbi:ABC transporter permease [Fusicatenibacter sp. CLA-AA-H277]|uniref:ABC transporter permease n=2 Tax=Fusicatenibacter faecihominis TaxID=2881276 RepID=A0AAE3DSK7_9FIRM|nr:ABC transporter permease [Fusicatenibacter faecihominis]MCC2189967.1 ABC transporter permease [Fusicatenibacter faecihominis]
MRNPLWKRLPRELVGDIGKYLVIFLFMTATIGFVSGFLVADESMLEAYDESFEKYRIENGNFTLDSQATEEKLEELEQEGVTIYENFYLDEPVDVDLDGTSDGTMRIFKKREEVNLVCLMKGTFPETADEIAIDRMYADNNSLAVGDTITVGGKELKITGLVALSDYSALFSDPGDLMFDSVKFGVSVLTPEGFAAFSDTHMKYCYSWLYEKEPADDTEEKEMADDFLEVLAAKADISGYLPGYLNQAIRFTGDDMGGDKAMVEVLLYILIAIMAFVFAVTTNNTIQKEAAVIGTLRASGYTRRELLLHYISLPILVTILAAVIGNILGYTVFKGIVADMYYGSYSLPTYETRWNAEAFYLTTLVPFVIMAIINVVLIRGKLKISPLRFLRKDLGSTRRSKAVRLPNFKFFNRFRIRILIQNRASYLTLFIGIVFANILLLFGMMMSPLLSHYQEETINNMLAKYQYILSVPDELDVEENSLLGMVQKLLMPSLETENENAEKFCMESLKMIPEKEGKDGESITIYGIEPDSKYVEADFSGLSEKGVLLSDGFQQKYGIKTGDTISLKEPYGSKTYEFQVGGFYDYPGALAFFMPAENFRRLFGKKEAYFNGYFSDEELTDLDDDYVTTTITQDDLTKVSRQLDVSMGEMFQLFNVFSLILFALLIYLLTKLIIEKNASSISMVKILGYKNREIVSLYLVSTTWVVIFSVLASFFFATELIKDIYIFMMSEYSGWLTLYIEPSIYGKMFALGMLVYALVAVLQFRSIKKIPMDEALKNVE